MTLYSDDADDAGRPTDLEVAGTVEYSPPENCWVAAIDWKAMRHVPVPNANGANPARPVADKAN